MLVKNIQDPHNAQNYNKYGYVMNNPLMYNDPSGESFWSSFIPAVLSFVTLGIAGVLWYGWGLLQGKTPWQAFWGVAKLGISITASFALGGLGVVFQAGGFWAAVGNGAITGGIMGGVNSILNGQNFIEGMIKGAVIGGAVAGITYSIQSLAYNSSNTEKGLTAKDIKGEISYDSSISNEEMNCNISETEGKLFTTKDNFGVGKQGLGKSADGYLDMGENGTKKFLAYTGRRNFWTGKSDIVYSPRIAQNKYLLKFTMLHETGHAYSNILFLPDLKIEIEGVYNDTTEHLALGFLEHDVANVNNLDFRPSTFFTSRYILEKTLKELPNTQLINAFNRTYRLLQPIFNRKISFP